MAGIKHEKSPARSEKENSPSSRFEEDLTNYKPGLIISDPRHMDFFELDKTPAIDRLANLSASAKGETNLADSFESYVSKSFAGAYSRFDDDPMLRKIKTDTTTKPDPKYVSRYSKSSNYLDIDDQDEKLTADSLASLYNEYNRERAKNYDFEVYQPKYTGRYSDAKSSVHMRDVRYEKAWSPPNLERSVSGYKSSFSKIADMDEDNLNSRDRDRYQSPRTRQMIIDTSKYGYRKGKTDEGSTMYPARNDYLRSNDSCYVGSNFVMLTLRSPDRWYNKVDKLLKEARET